MSSRPGLLVLLLIFIKIFAHDLDLCFLQKKGKIYTKNEQESRSSC